MTTSYPHDFLMSLFQNNYAGSPTKRALGYARRFEDVFDVLSFQVASTVLPLGFVAVVLWAYSPWLIVLLIGMLAATLVMVFPLIRRRRLLVDVRETASNVLAGTSPTQSLTLKPCGRSRGNRTKLAFTRTTSAITPPRRCGPGITRTCGLIS
jgi:hypothetical protein